LIVLYGIGRDDYLQLFSAAFFAPARRELNYLEIIFVNVYSYNRPSGIISGFVDWSVCVRACVRACARACVRSCACVRACVRVRVCERERRYIEIDCIFQRRFCHPQLVCYLGYGMRNGWYLASYKNKPIRLPMMSLLTNEMSEFATIPSKLVSVVNIYATTRQMKFIEFFCIFSRILLSWLLFRVWKFRSTELTRF